MYLAALDSERFVMVSDSVGFGAGEQAVHLPIGVVEQLDLCHAKFVALPVFVS